MNDEQRAAVPDVGDVEVIARDDGGAVHRAAVAGERREAEAAASALVAALPTGAVVEHAPGLVATADGWRVEVHVAPPPPRFRLGEWTLVDVGESYAAAAAHAARAAEIVAAVAESSADPSIAGEGL